MDHSITDRIHLADLTPQDTLILDALGLAAQACLLPQFHLASQVGLLRSAMVVSIITDLTHLADLILLDTLNQAALVYLHHPWDPSFLADLLRSVMRSSTTTDLIHLAGLTHLGRLCHRLCPRVSLIPSLVERLLFNPYNSIW